MSTVVVNEDVVGQREASEQKFYAVLSKLNKGSIIVQPSLLTALGAKDGERFAWSDDGRPIAINYDTHHVVPAEGTIIQCAAENANTIKQAFRDAGFAAVSANENTQVVVMFD